MSIKIVKPAVVTMIVGEGREGFRSLGIGPTAAMDNFAMRVANYLVGNDDYAAVLEIGYSHTEVVIQDDCLVAFAGKGFEVHANDVAMPLWKPIGLKAGTILKLQKKTGGVWCYLSVHGGWEAQTWLRSFTTNLVAMSGGFHGRLLKKEDVVETSKSVVEFSESKVLPWGISMNELNTIYSPTNTIRCISSVETDLLSLASREKLTSDEFIVTPQSNRMGYRLKGEPLSVREKIELISSPVDFGTVQLLPDGNMIVLMADHQTTGGYPRIASVIKADLPKLAQLMPGEKLNFKMISLSEAQTELLSLEQKLLKIKKACFDRFKKYFL